MHLHLNPLGGLAGDMFCAAVLDAYPDLITIVRRAVAAVPMPCAVRVRLTQTEGSLKGKRFRVMLIDADPPHHTPYREVRALLERAGLDAGVRDRAFAIFDLLAEAEAKIHDREPESVAFHEVGAWDSIADIVSAASLLEALDVTSASCTPLPLGTGRVVGSHGVLPVPAPATTLLLQDLPVSYDGIEGERVTPTGAAILRSLGPRPSVPAGALLRASGMGFGIRELAGLPNCLQVLCLQVSAIGSGFETDRVELLRFEVDDQTPEDLAIGLERLRATEGVLSVITLQAAGKRGRPTMAVEVLAQPDRLDAVADICFRETSTIGLRRESVDRLILRREQREVVVSGQKVGVKISYRPQGPTAKAESASLVGIDGHGPREALRKEAVTAALNPAQIAPDGTGDE